MTLSILHRTPKAQRQVCNTCASGVSNEGEMDFKSRLTSGAHAYPHFPMPGGPFSSSPFAFTRARIRTSALPLCTTLTLTATAFTPLWPPSARTCSARQSPTPASHRRLSCPLLLHAQRACACYSIAIVCRGHRHRHQSKLHLLATILLYSGNLTCFPSSTGTALSGDSLVGLRSSQGEFFSCPPSVRPIACTARFHWLISFLRKFGCSAYPGIQ